MNRQERFGPFILECLLGRGGMGAVYRAKHDETGQTVAVKTLLTPLESERERFEAEISTLKLLRHENIVKLYGFGQEDGVLYYAMEYVAAPSLATLLKRGRRFTWEEVVYIGVAVCRALKHAHDRGVVHRDVKPANILLLDDGVVKVTDYGIAQYFGSSRLTGANQVVGTIEYMAPEQAQAGPLTPRTDVYALGALLYALLTGEPPYRARSLPELLRRYNEETPESIRRARPEAPNVLDAFLRELLQISPEKRPGDARLIGRRLEGILKTASGIKDGNPFLNQRFFLDGRSSVAKPNDGENERCEDAQVKTTESFSDAAPDIPYRSLSDERLEENDASPFERTTEINVVDKEAGAVERDANESTSTLRTDARTDDGGDFGLATVALPAQNSNDGDFDLATVALPTQNSNDGDFDLATVALPAQNSNDGDFDLATVALPAQNSNDGDFDLATVALPAQNSNDDEATAAIAFGSGNGETEADFRASTVVEVTIAEPDFKNDKPFPAPTRTENGFSDSDDDFEFVEASSLDKYKKSRFTPVDERELDALPTRNEKKSPLWWTAQILFLLVVLGGLAALSQRVRQAPTADRLYRRIEEELRVPESDFSSALKRAEKDLRRMVELYPSDPRSENANEWLERLEIDAMETRLERRLERRRRDDAARPIERAYLEAGRAAEQNPDEGVAKLTAFIDLFASEALKEFDVDDPNEALCGDEVDERSDAIEDAALTKTFVVVATRKLEKLVAERDKARADDLAFIAERWAAAVALAETDRAAAEKIRLALLELYGERPWAGDALRDAKATDWSDGENAASQN